jgi:cytochrome c556
MRKRIFATIGGAACVMAFSAVAAGTANDAVLARQTALKSIGKTFKEIHGISDIGAQRALLVSDAAKLKTLAPQPWSYFGPETANTTAKNEALPVIWSDPAGFKAAQSKMITAVNELDAVAATGTPAVVGRKIAAVGDSCGACHRAFRAK